MNRNGNGKIYAGRSRKVGIPEILTIAGFLVTISGLVSGCSTESGVDAAKSGANAPVLTAETIKNDPNMSQGDKDKYLRQLKENEMAARMNPNVSAPTEVGSTPPPPPE